MIDSHCHLADKQFAADFDAVLQRAEEHGVDMLVSIADSLDEGRACLLLAEKYSQIFCTVGVHPHNAKDWKAGDAKILTGLLQQSSKAVAVGEIGLDYHYNNSPPDVQRVVFEEQLSIARDLNVPAVIHCREAIDDLKKIVDRVSPPRVVIHCCTEKWEDVVSLIELGHLLSFTGIATYPKSDDIRRTIKECPLAQLMIETDAPYLAPVPYRGQRNEPAFVTAVAECVAEVKGIDLAEVDRQTTANAVAFFRIGA